MNPRTNNIRIQLTVTGRVQGVGFRPTVYQYALALELTGFVENSTNGVTIEIEGPPDKLEAFIYRLSTEPPPLAKIEAMSEMELTYFGYKDFQIRSSKNLGESHTEIPTDTAVCADCLREMNDINDRRYQYPFINCTNCGPRFTIIEDLPYDRPFTSMREFEMCADCRAEYENPLDRRFHAQPISCPQCGPTLQLIQSDGAIVTSSPMVTAIEYLQQGKILGMKGLGGYHICCDATHEAAVQALRLRKHRPDKPFALMMPDIATVKRYCEVSGLEEMLLTSREAPIVLLLRKHDGNLSAAIAPDMNRFGVMLPYTPLHHLIIQSFDALVMTSANYSEEPLISDEIELKEILGPVLDAALVHNRPVVHKCDDSIMKITGGHTYVLRRARGHIPNPIPLTEPSMSIFAAGADLKACFALSKGNKAYLSQHLGDLENYKTLQSYEFEYNEFRKLLEIEPVIVVHDLHPDYGSTRFAQSLKINHTFAVQHHHAHIASCLADNLFMDPVIGLAFDGTGYGTDGNIWGSEFFIGNIKGFMRVAHWDYVPLPGGDKAAEEPWRMAVAYLYHLYGKQLTSVELPWLKQLPETQLDLILQMLEKKINSPLSCGMGRMFDGVYGLLGHMEKTYFEGRGGMVLESLADATVTESYPIEFRHDDDEMILLYQPLFQGIVEDILSGKPVSFISGKFHQTLAQSTFQVCRRLKEQYHIETVALSGGCFQNTLLTEQIIKLLLGDGFQILTHHQVPPNDGGIALGQLTLAQHRVSE